MSPIERKASEKPTQGGIKGANRTKKGHDRSHDALSYRVIAVTVRCETNRFAPCYPLSFFLILENSSGMGTPAVIFGLWWQIRWGYLDSEEGSSFDGLDGNEAKPRSVTDFLITICSFNSWSYECIVRILPLPRCRSRFQIWKSQYPAVPMRHLTTLANIAAPIQRHRRKPSRSCNCFVKNL